MNSTAEDGPKELDPVHIIESITDLEALGRLLLQSPRVAIDLESDSFYSYHHKICLIQISDERHDYIVDPLAVRDISPLGPVLREPKIEKVFHAAEYDIQCLKRDYGFEINGLFDTMAAARILGIKELGLAALILKYFEVSLSKKLQRADWGKRPLSDAQIDYARMDTHYLLRLRDLLHAELTERGVVHDAQEECRRLERVECTQRAFDPNAFWRLPGAKNLPPPARAVLREVYVLRERTAAEMDKAPFRVMPELLLVRVAERLPKSLDEVEALSGMTPYLFKRFGREILDAVSRGLAAEPIDSQPERPHGDRWDIATMMRYQLLRQWRKQKAADRGLDPVVILTTEDLRKLAKAPAASPEEAHWLSLLTDRKRELYGPEVLEILKTPPPEPTAKRRRRRRRK